MNGITACFTGRLAQDPEPKYTSSGKPMLRFACLVDENTAGAPPHYVNCVAWEEDADRLASVLRKGVFVYAEGRLKLDRWTGSDGTPRAGLSMSAWRVDVIGAIGRRRPDAPEQRPAERQPVAAGAGQRRLNDLDQPF